MVSLVCPYSQSCWWHFSLVLVKPDGDTSIQNTPLVCLLIRAVAHLIMRCPFFTLCHLVMLDSWLLLCTIACSCLPGLFVSAHASSLTHAWLRPVSLCALLSLSLFAHLFGLSVFFMALHLSPVHRGVEEEPEDVDYSTVSIFIFKWTQISICGLEEGTSLHNRWVFIHVYPSAL